MYRPSDNPLEIIHGLHKAYGMLTPTEKKHTETTWSLPWNTGELIELYLLLKPQKIFILATKHPPAYTIDQMVGKAKTAMEQCGLFQTALLEFNAFLDEH